MFTLGLTRVTDTVAEHLSLHLSKLEELGIGNTARITGKGIELIANELYNLRSLHIPGLRCEYCANFI
jgi:hypothetical protein